MNNGISIKNLCDEISNTSHSEEQTIKLLTKFLNLLKNPEKFQKDIFLNLSDRGLNRLLSLLKDKNENIRKMSFLVVIDLLYNNEVLQNIFCEKYNFNPIGNVICINWLPAVFKEKITLDANLIIELKRCSNCSGSSTKYWKWPNNPKYTDELIPDPERYLLGFFYSNKMNVIQKKETTTSNYDTQKIIDILEEGYQPSTMNINIASEGKNNKDNNQIRQEYKKAKVKNASRSIDFKQNNLEKGVKNKK